MRWRRLLIIALVVAGLGYLARGWAVVAPGEAVVVRRWGRVVGRPWAPGPHWGWPVGIERRVRVRTDEVRRLEIGLAEVAGPDEEPGAGEFLTGDRNFLRARGVVQYRVADPVAFVLRAEEVDRVLGRSAEASLTRALSRRGVDAALRSGRAEVAREAEADLARVLAPLNLGVAILGVSLTDARPPAEVQPDFAAAQAAQSEHDRRLREAKSYESTTLSAARAEAGARLERAKATADRMVTLAQGRAERFVALLAEAERSRALTVRRLYFDALRDLLPRVRRKLLLTPEEPVDLSILGVDKE